MTTTPALNDDLAEKTWRELEGFAGMTGDHAISMVSLPISKVRALVDDRRALAAENAALRSALEASVKACALRAGSQGDVEYPLFYGDDEPTVEELEAVARTPLTGAR